MKIAKKLSLVFIGSTLLILSICLLCGVWILNGLKNGEVERAVSKSSSIYSLYNKRIADITDVANELSEAVVIEYFVKEESKQEVYKNISKNLNEMFNKNDILYAGFFLNDNEKFYNVRDSGVSDKLLQSLYELSKGKEHLSGSIKFNDKLYIVSIDKIDKDYKQKAGKVIVIKEVDSRFLNLLKYFSGKDAEIELNYEPLEKPTAYIGREKVPVYNEVLRDRIISYIGINTLEEGRNIYLTITEGRTVVDKSNLIVSKLIGILLILILFINAITFLIVRNNLIKRIITMNKDVNDIISSKDKSSHLKIDKEDDEITGLTVDINKMIDNIREVTLNLDSSKMQYKALLKTMTNGFIYLKREDYKIYKVIQINNSAKKMINLSDGKLEYFKGSSEIEKLLGVIEKNIDLSKKETYEEVYLGEGNFAKVSFQYKEDDSIVLVLNDITDLKKYSDEMKYLANYDTLTGVLNRHNIMKYIEDLTLKEEPYTIYFIDLDNFKGLNDTLGHNKGDEVLCAVSKSLNIICSDFVRVGRLGGDEFVVVKRGENDILESEDLAQTILEVLSSIIRVNKLTFELSGSIGISYYPLHSKDMNEVIQYADIAMYEAKSSGGNNYKIFSNDMLESVELENRLKEAILKDEFELYYQPIYDIKENKIKGAEALIRWNADEGIISPARFIPIAKRTGDIIEIDKIVFDKAIKYCKYITTHSKDFIMSVNLSYKYLKQYNFIDDLKSIIKKYDLDPKNLRVEVTEDEFIEDIVETTRILNEIRTLGISVSLDDFGTGYSSFNYLKQLPIDIIKIDRSLLYKVCTDEKSLNILSTIINLSHELGFIVVCEGVEEVEEFELLKTLGCDKIQGYYISRPICEEDFKEKIIKFL
ncbi:MAG: EAL domain-containing protein [Clostridium sp.]|uniref:putative bifunctional diguanylate cyclase/phosphodiesterase n=1 Tax=Clostridium chrysemydis TaxID=2665504 RepID=UPI003EE477B7